MGDRLKRLRERVEVALGTSEDTPVGDEVEQDLKKETEKPKGEQ